MLSAPRGSRLLPVLQPNNFSPDASQGHVMFVTNSKTNEQLKGSINTMRLQEVRAFISPGAAHGHFC
jgi:hypothetical protein